MIDSFVLVDILAMPRLRALLVNDCPRLTESAFVAVQVCCSDFCAIAVGGTDLDYSMFAWLASHLHSCGACASIVVRHSLSWKDYVDDWPL